MVEAVHSASLSHIILARIVGNHEAFRTSNNNRTARGDNADAADDHDIFTCVTMQRQVVNWLAEVWR